MALDKNTETNACHSVINIKCVGISRVKGLDKGIIITTVGFTKSPEKPAERSANPQIVLIDDKWLAEYMIKYNVGVSIEKTYEIKRVDSDYFAENTETS